MQIRHGERAQVRSAGTQSALQLAKDTGVTLVTAKFNRLSRRVAFMVALPTPVCLPRRRHVRGNDYGCKVHGLVAVAERHAISRRTKTALAVAKARGARFGYPNGAAAIRRAGKGASGPCAGVSANADDFAADVAPVNVDIGSGFHIARGDRGGGYIEHDAHAAEWVVRLWESERVAGAPRCPRGLFRTLICIKASFGQVLQ